MNPSKMTRREALAAVAVSPLLAAAQAPKPADTSWVGLTVMVKGNLTRAMQPTPWPNVVPRPPGVPDTPEVRQTSVILHDLSYTVKAEKDARVQLIGGTGEPVWAEKAAFVPLADAVAFYTDQMKGPNATPGTLLNARGWAHKLLGRRADALKDFDEVLKDSPDWGDALTNRGVTLAEAGKFDRAMKDLTLAVERPSHVAVAICSFGYCHELRGEFDKAIPIYRFAHAHGSLLAGNNLAWVRATCPDAKFRDWAEAVSLAKTVCDKCENLEGMYVDTLAVAMAETGKFDDAVKTQELAHKDKSYDTAYGDEGRARLALYKQRKPFRTEPPKK